MSHPYVNTTFFLSTSRHLQQCAPQKSSKIAALQCPIAFILPTSHILSHSLSDTICHEVQAIYGQPGKVEEVPQRHASGAETRCPGCQETGEFLRRGHCSSLSLRRFLQHSLPGRTIKAMKAHLVGLLPPKPLPPDCMTPSSTLSVSPLLAEFPLNGLQ
jgi:hypothetical protein